MDTSKALDAAQETYEADARNDIAKGLMTLIRLLRLDTSKGLGRTLCNLANLFETLDGDDPICIPDLAAYEPLTEQYPFLTPENVRTFAKSRAGQCFGDFLTGLQVDVMTHLAGLAGDATVRLQAMVACLLNPQRMALRDRENPFGEDWTDMATPQLELSAACLWKAVWKIITTGGDFAAGLNELFRCIFGGDGGGGGGGGGGGTADGPHHNPIDRCNG